VTALVARRNLLGQGAVDVALKTADGELVAVVTRPCAGAKWFLHRAGTFARVERFSTCKAAIAAAEAA